jgi:phage terminase large subunit-like protein
MLLGELEKLPPKQQLLYLLEEKKRRSSQNKLATLYPETGPLRRELYPKHMEFFAAGLTYRERCAMCANRIGKSFGMGGYESSLHATGLYPDWWKGKRFDGANDGWAAGKTNETTRDIVQKILFGDVLGSGASKRLSGPGLIPGLRIGAVTWKQGVTNLVDTVQVKHVSGDWSEVGLKSYQQGRGAFEGTEKHWVWLDEEPPEDIYGECVIRTATTDGTVYLTFTPLDGMTQTVMSFLPANFDEVMREAESA